MAVLSSRWSVFRNPLVSLYGHSACLLESSDLYLYPRCSSVENVVPSQSPLLPCLFLESALAPGNYCFRSSTVGVRCSTTEPYTAVPAWD